MTPRGAPPAPPTVARHVRRWGALLLLALVLLTALQAPWTERLQAAWFDAHQALHPRAVHALPVTVVAIDQASLRALGQWPWPRRTLARLVDAIQAARPAAIGLDILMPEADALSPERLLGPESAQDGALAAALRARPSNDALLAQSLAAAPTVLAVAGMPEATGLPLRAAPVTVRDLASGRVTTPAVAQYGGALSSIDELNRRAAGWGLFSVDATRGIVRRMPLVASIQGTLVPTLALEMLRVAAGAPALRMTTWGSAVQRVEVGGLSVPTEGDGAVRVYFSPHRDDRFVSAVDVLQGRVDPALLHRQLVLVGPTAIGLHDAQDTPLGESLSGSEIQAQLLENLLEGSMLQRPRWAPRAEAAMLLLSGLLLVWATPRWRPTFATLLAAGLLACAVLAAWAAFRVQGLLFDAATPGLSLLLLFGLLLALSLAESTRQRRLLERVVQSERVQHARLAGELDAARRIQTASLPREDLLQADPRIDLHAALTPASEVGGDAYDFFMLDEHRLFVLVADVAGKGLSASIFMAVSKALVKGVVLRAPHADLGALMAQADFELSRDNGQQLFVAAFAAMLDLDSGELAYCNAGHDNPWRLRAGSAQAARITDGDGPPLCAMRGYDYRGARCRLAPGELLCLLTDGVGEAQDRAGATYGTARVQRLLERLNPAGASTRDVVAELQADVAAFAQGAEPHDDLTILALRWNGPARAAPDPDPDPDPDSDPGSSPSPSPSPTPGSAPAKRA